MKNIPRFLCLVIVLTLAPGLSAQRRTGRSPLHFSAEFFGGFIYGTGTELIYDAPSGAEYMSMLIWDMKPLYYLGLDASLRVDTPLPWFSPFLRASAKIGLGGRTGHMEDRDWLGRTQQYLTHFSRHDNTTAWAFLADCNLGLRFRPWERGILPRFSLFLRVSLMDLRWESRDGYYQHAFDAAYAPQDIAWDPGQEKKPSPGPAINYSQIWEIVAPGLEVEFSPLPSLTLGAGLVVGPVIYGLAEDFHFRAGQKDVYDNYRDTLRGGLYVRPELRATVAVSDRIFLGLRGSWTLITGSRGDSYKKYEYDGKTIWPMIMVDRAGGGLESWEAGLGIGIRL